jgi:hypothetical protein
MVMVTTATCAKQCLAVSLEHLKTDYFQPKTAWVTIDNGLHEAGDRLTCIYSTDRRQLNSEVVVETRNGKSVLLTIPAAGFLIYE